MRLDRLNEMENYVLRKGSASLDELSHQFSISINTVRRDVVTLLERGQLQKVYGGVASSNPKNGGPFSMTVTPMSERATLNSAEKQTIGKLASTLVENNMNIFVDSGSTAVWIIPHIADKTNVTVVSHSLSALYEASKHPSVGCISLGGIYNETTSSFVGGITLNTLSDMTMDIAFLASTGVSLERGLTNTTYFEVEIKRLVVKQNKKLVLMADHTKFGHDALLTFANISDLYAIVTDKPLPQAYMDAAKRKGVRVITPATDGESAK